MYTLLAYLLTYFNGFNCTINEFVAGAPLQPSAASWIRQLGGTGSYNFPTGSGSANFRQRGLRVLKNSILLQISLKWRF